MYEHFKAKYPKLFNDADFIEFCVGDGWKDILERLFEKIAPEMEKCEAVVQQVKEKLGGLRFYTSTENDAIGKAISEAENEADETCEYCGSKEDVKKSGGWIKTLCAKCRCDRDKAKADEEFNKGK